MTSTPVTPPNLRLHRSVSAWLRDHEVLRADSDVTSQQAGISLTEQAGVRSNETPKRSKGSDGSNGSSGDDAFESSYLRFSTRLHTVQNTQPIKDLAGVLSATKWRAFIFVVFAYFGWTLVTNLFPAPRMGAVPDFVKVASLARSFEPSIYYSMYSQAHISDLSMTSKLLWDLGESIRNTTMTSTPIVVQQLDGLNDDINTFAVELAYFFSGVDGDIERSLLAIDLAQRDLAGLLSAPASIISSNGIRLRSNAHDLFSQMGLGQFARRLFGQSHQQLAYAVLDRIFNKFLIEVDDIINTELAHSVNLLELVLAMDKKAVNLQHNAIQEQASQEALENDLLGGVWTSFIGINANKLREYEKTRDMLAILRNGIARSRHLFIGHGQHLQQLHSSLEVLKQELARASRRSRNSSASSIKAQCKALGSAYGVLKSSRGLQQRRTLATVNGEA